MLRMPPPGSKVDDIDSTKNLSRDILALINSMIYISHHNAFAHLLKPLVHMDQNKQLRCCCDIWKGNDKSWLCPYDLFYSLT